MDRQHPHEDPVGGHPGRQRGRRQGTSLGHRMAEDVATKNVSGDGGGYAACPCALCCFRQLRRDMSLYDSKRDEILERVQQPARYYRNPPIQIHTQEDLTYFAEVVGTRYDWHEPDEQDLTAAHYGTSFDNAGFWGDAEFMYSDVHA